MDNVNNMEYRIGLEKQNKRDDQVTELILDNCRATQISGLTDDFVNLETLSLINVGLTTLKGFPRLPKLKKLELSDNRLAGGLNLLHGSPNLQHLNISGNRFKDLEALEPLKEFRNLASLDLYNCDVTKVEDYREKVFELIPNLQALDGFDKNEVEVNSADENDDDEDEDDEEESDVEHHIARNGSNGGKSVEDLSDSNEGVADEEDSDDDEYDDDDDDDEDLDDEEFDDDGGEDSGEDEEEIAQNSSGELGGSTQGGEVGEVYDDEVQEIIEDDDGADDEEDEDNDDDGTDLKVLQKDSIVDDSDDEDFEPTHEPDERDHEIDPEDDVDEDENADLSTSKLDTTVNNESGTDHSNERRGTKRKLEDDGAEAGGDN